MRDGSLCCWDDTGEKINPPAPYLRVVNLDTGEEITKCVYADEYTGEYERYVTNEVGLIRLNAGRTEPLRERGRVTRLKILPVKMPGE